MYESYWAWISTRHHHASEDERHGKPDYAELIAKCPEDLKELFEDHVIIPWYRDPELRSVCISKILKKWILDLHKKKHFDTFFPFWHILHQICPHFFFSRSTPLKAGQIAEVFSKLMVKGRRLALNYSDRWCFAMMTQAVLHLMRRQYKLSTAVSYSSPVFGV